MRSTEPLPIAPLKTVVLTGVAVTFSNELAVIPILLNCMAHSKTSTLYSSKLAAPSSIFMLASSRHAARVASYIAGNGDVNIPGSSAKSWIFNANGGTPGIEADHSFGTYGSTTAALNTEQRLDGTNPTVCDNSVAGTPAALSFSLTTQGSLSAASGSFTGSLREVIFYNTALGSTDRACMDAYLVSRQ